MKSTTASPTTASNAVSRDAVPRLPDRSLAAVRHEYGPPAGIEIDGAGTVVALSGLPSGWAAPAWQGAAAMRGTPVLRDGRQVGTLVSEACVARDGVLQSCDGQPSARLRVRVAQPAGVASRQAEAG